MSNKTCLLIERAKTGRSTCHYCKLKIREKDIRLSLLVKSSWYHEYCFIKVRQVSNIPITKITCGNNIRLVHKDRIQKLLERYTGTMMSMETPSTSTNLQTLSYFSIDYSKTNHSLCRYCKQRIAKGTMQVSHDAELCARYRIKNCSRHIHCFEAERDVLGYMAGGEDLPGFYKLERKDQEIVKSVIKSRTANDVPIETFEENLPPILPLENLQFFIYSENPQEPVRTRILQLGGQVTNTLTEAHAVVVLTERDIKKWDVLMSEIRKTGIMVVKESFFNLINPAGTVEALQLIISYNIAPSILPKPVQKLMVQIFNIKLMNRALEEFQLDMRRVPMLSKNQILEMYYLLIKLQEYMHIGCASGRLIAEASERFFTKIPHIGSLPFLDNDEVINQKTYMLDNLLEMDIAFNLLKIQGDIAIPIDRYYSALNADITPVGPDKPNEYNMILDYVNNTHLDENSNYRLEVKQVFKVIRKGEEESYRQCKALKNCRLLWHGSRLSNMVGILSQGLCIMPPLEGPLKNYTFGKGLHFSDMVSQAANYCCASPDNPTGIVLLCEVALGNMQHCKNEESVPRLELNEHSTWVMGRIQPYFAHQRVLPDGVILPLGKLVLYRSNEVMYNDFIIYYEDQVNIKYLVELKFNFRS